jgi:hypothetical protein
VLVVPVQAPVQLVKVVPAVGVAVKVTTVLGAKLAVQVVPQLIPVGLLVIVPIPVPTLVKVNAKGVRVKVAPTLCAALIDTVQVLTVPVQAPVQLVKVEPVLAAAVKVTLAFWLKLAEQVVPQLMPAGELLTDPAPVPALVTANCTWVAVKVAVTAFAALMDTVQVVAVPEQAPVQFVKVDPALAAAVKVTLAFWLKLAEQVAPQLMPAGELVTVPAPVPALVTANCTWVAVKVAVTAFAALMGTVHVLAVPVQAPVQLVKVDPALAAAVKVTLVFWLKLAEQVTPQLMPAGELVTVPAAVPALVTVSVSGIGVKVAVTVFAALMDTVQVVVVPVQAPDQLVKLEPALAAAVMVTLVLVV